MSVPIPMYMRLPQVGFDSWILYSHGHTLKHQP